MILNIRFKLFILSFTTFGCNTKHRLLFKGEEILQSDDVDFEYVTVKEDNVVKFEYDCKEGNIKEVNTQLILFLLF